jgi:hypothetical protein
VVGVASPYGFGGDGAPVGKPGAFAAAKKKCGLSLDMAVRLLKAALPQPMRSVGEALRIVEYHLYRNEVAKNSHAKRWRAQHPGVQGEPLTKTFSPSMMC